MMTTSCTRQGHKQTTFEEAHIGESVIRPQEERGMVLSLVNRLKEQDAMVDTVMGYDNSESDDDNDE